MKPKWLIDSMNDFTQKTVDIVFQTFWVVNFTYKLEFQRFFQFRQIFNSFRVEC